MQAKSFWELWNTECKAKGMAMSPLYTVQFLDNTPRDVMFPFFSNILRSVERFKIQSLYFQRNSSRYLLDRRLCGPQNLCGFCKSVKILPPCGNQTPAIQVISTFLHKIPEELWIRTPPTSVPATIIIDIIIIIIIVIFACSSYKDWNCSYHFFWTSLAASHLRLILKEQLREFCSKYSSRLFWHFVIISVLIFDIFISSLNIVNDLNLKWRNFQYMCSAIKRRLPKNKR